MKIAVLGPKGTYTERAADYYMRTMNMKADLEYHSSIRTTFEAIGQECNYGVIPIENSLDGFVQMILDLLAHSNLKIIHEVVLPIRFGFVSKASSMDQVRKIYAQFKTQNQCLDFLEKNNGCELITTGSNSISYDKAIKGDSSEGAIIPMHIIRETNVDCFKTLIADVADSLENETRFLILTSSAIKPMTKIIQKEYKTLMMVHGHKDHPGLLAEILSVLAEEKINLVSIMSRPTRKGLGTYNFFMEVQGCYPNDANIRRAIEKAMTSFDVEILGTYYRV